MARHIHHEDMADAAFGAQASGGGRDLTHQFVRMQAALHKELALSLSYQGDCLRRSGVAMWSVDDFVLFQIKPILRGHRPNFLRRPHQDRNDQSVLGGFKRAPQRGLVAGMRDDRDGRLNLPCSGNQAIIFGRLKCRRGQVSHWEAPSASIRMRCERERSCLPF